MTTTPAATEMLCDGFASIYKMIQSNAEILTQSCVLGMLERLRQNIVKECGFDYRPEHMKNLFSVWLIGWGR